MRHRQNDSAGDQAETHMGPINGISELIGQHGFARDGLDQTSSADGPENLRKNRHDREGADVGPREQACQKDKDDEGEELVRHETDRKSTRLNSSHYCASRMTYSA